MRDLSPRLLCIFILLFPLASEKQAVQCSSSDHFAVSSTMMPHVHVVRSLFMLVHASISGGPCSFYRLARCPDENSPNLNLCLSA
mmetsp:Transcript_50095/g.98667  ORF Transcript_50095/g.98667 Transcript_50095/m.98667 type:complete len:85 (+) Transcript_50095:2334-2588(+)